MLACSRWYVDYPLNGKTCCTKQLCLQSGHSGFSLAQSLMHVQQNTCPHVVTLGSFISSKHRVHFLFPPPIQPIVSSSVSSYRGLSAAGVCVHFCRSDGADAAGAVASKRSALLALYAFGSRLTSAPPPTMADVLVGRSWVTLSGALVMVLWR
jgi:hypothetical protein